MNHYSKYPRHLVAVDCIIFGYDILEKEIKLLLSKRIFEPALVNGHWQGDSLNRMKVLMMLPAGFSGILPDWSLFI